MKYYTEHFNGIQCACKRKGREQHQYTRVLIANQENQRKDENWQSVSVCTAKEEICSNYVQIEIVGFHESFEYKFKDWLDEDEQVIVCQYK